jgi:hypothetical protein
MGRINSRQGEQLLAVAHVIRQIFPADPGPKQTKL